MDIGCWGSLRGFRWESPVASAGSVSPCFCFPSHVGSLHSGCVRLVEDWIRWGFRSLTKAPKVTQSRPVWKWPYCERTEGCLSCCGVAGVM
ncbi:hypothetical protein TcWFU_004409 [Taenia crassiceps]|uniref:Secreted protein n=1 Tax=Taenia crassiceps TaxID=6207 RepID=A0ABR4QQ84_9CEST